MDISIREKDTDERPLLVRVRDAFATGTAARLDDTRSDAGDLVKLVVTGDAVTVTATEATGIKGVILVVTGLAPKTEKALIAVRGVRVPSFRAGLEVSWCGLEAACTVLVAAMNEKPKAAPKARAPKASLGERFMSALRASQDVTWSDMGGVASVTSKAKPAAAVRVMFTSPGLVVAFSYAPDAVSAVKAVKGSQYVSTAKAWAFVDADEGRLLAAIERASRACGVAEAAKQAEWEAGEPARAAYAAKQRAERAAEQYARQREADQKRARREQENPRVLTLLHAGLREGEVLRSGDRVLVVTGFGKVFRVDVDMPSYMGSHLLGHEGDQCRYAYCRLATAEEAARLATQEADELAVRQARVRRARAVDTADKAVIAQGEVMETRVPDGSVLVGSVGGSWHTLYEVSDEEIWWRHDGGIQSDTFRRMVGPEVAALVAELRATADHSHLDA